MKFPSKWALATAGLAMIQSVAMADDTVKVGIIAPFSGPFASYGQQFKDGIDVYVAEHGVMAGTHKVEFVYKDSGGPNPAGVKAATQELLIKDGVKYLGGIVFTPNALAIAPLITQTKTPTVLFNAATSIINTKSPYFLRTSMTLPQVSAPMADWAIENGIKTVVTTVTDYGPGIDAETAFTKEFTAKGGKVIDAIRMPIQTSDFGPFLQRVKSKAPNAVFAFLPGGAPAFAFSKAYSDNGLAQAGIKAIGTGDIDDETTLQGLGASGIGIITSHHYSQAHDSPENKAFLAQLHKLRPNDVSNYATIGAYDGTFLLYKMISSTDGGDAAVKSVEGMSWTSPRGPVKLDPVSRSLDQNVYIREVVKGADGKLENKEIATYKDVPDLGMPAH
ncbi:MAG: ABC transporter substrate-binding protein [Hyphomicrobiales bacterium]|nr:ABC transporter substrate-binding protein [Hyphomicrobiales bacterium]